VGRGIIGLLAAYVAPRYFSQIGKSETTVAKAQIEAFDKALDQFRLDVGRFPTTEEGLNALVVKPAIGKWNGPYLRKSIPDDHHHHHQLEQREPSLAGRRAQKALPLIYRLPHCCSDEGRKVVQRASPR